MQKCDVDARLLLSVKYLHSYSGGCVRDRGAKLQPFTVLVELPQGGVLSPLLVIFKMNLIDNRSRVEEGIITGSVRTNRLLSTGDPLLLASFEQGL